jgi:hypothetical protein
VTTRPEVMSTEVQARVSKSLDELAAEFETLLGKDAPALRAIRHLAANFPPARVDAATEAGGVEDDWGPVMSVEEAAEL